jgi:hypothetical protein
MFESDLHEDVARQRVTRRAFLAALASKAPNVPQLRTETFSREMIYGEHA